MISPVKERAPDYFAWAFNICLCASASLFIDFIPDDGNIRELTAHEDMILGQSLERMTKSRLRRIGSVSRFECSAFTTPEVFFLGVLQAKRLADNFSQTEREREEKQRMESAEDAPTAAAATLPAAAYFGGKAKFMPHVFIVQNIDTAPVRTMHCLVEMLHCNKLSVPPSATTVLSSDSIDLPHDFIVIATSTRAPVVGGTSSSKNNDGTLPERLLSGFLLRIPVLLPTFQPREVSFQFKPRVHNLSRQEVIATKERIPNVFMSPQVLNHIRELSFKIRTHTSVKLGLSPSALDSFMLVLRVVASLSFSSRGGLFVIPDDFSSCVLESVAHRLWPKRSACVVDDVHAWNLSRQIVAEVVSSLPVLK